MFKLVEDSVNIISRIFSLGPFFNFINSYTFCLTIQCPDKYFFPENQIRIQNFQKTIEILDNGNMKLNYFIY
ncbi:hypothetical protein DRO42_05045 [Candidatus Bathyarchaeota archaeon]|nr:MAG: hypothetical protein DRO42_05045 [Candidatus Bathyarchaeota archaeon]